MRQEGPSPPVMHECIRGMRQGGPHPRSCMSASGGYPHTLVTLVTFAFFFFASTPFGLWDGSGVEISGGHACMMVYASNEGVMSLQPLVGEMRN